MTRRVPTGLGRLAGALLLAALAGCGGGAQTWDKPGVASDRKSADLADCRSQARTASQRDTNIDNDILNSRSTDWQRSGTLTTMRDSMQSSNTARFGDLVARCMAGKGYSAAG